MLVTHPHTVILSRVLVTHSHCHALERVGYPSPHHEPLKSVGYSSPHCYPLESAGYPSPHRYPLETISECWLPIPSPFIPSRVLVTHPYTIILSRQSVVTHPRTVYPLERAGYSSPHHYPHWFAATACTRPPTLNKLAES